MTGPGILGRKNHSHFATFVMLSLEATVQDRMGQES